MSSPRDLLVEQLWAPALGDGNVRIGQGTPSAGWREAESYWMCPTAARARLVLPRGPRAVTSGAALHYRGLRRPGKNLARQALGAAAAAGLPLSGDRLGVWVRDRVDAAGSGLLLAQLARELGVPRLYAAMGVRAGANRKATLHLLDAAGSPVGYAKVGWNAITDEFVRTEAAVLGNLGGIPGPTRAPALLAQVDHYGHPVIVTEPLPLSARGARSRGVRPPTSEEFFALTPVVRRARPEQTLHLRAVRERVGTAAGDSGTRSLRHGTAGLAAAVAACPVELPVTSRWHGDFTPWNRARDRSGQLWVWDWESSEEDALAGLDPLHWAFSERRPASGRSEHVDLPACLDDARGHLVAAGVPRSGHGVVAATYAVTVIERALDLAERSGGWQRLWIQPDHLEELLGQARALLSQE